MSRAERVAAAEPALWEDHRLGMPEMGYRGLSEQWLMRRAGDLHWRLIAAAMGQDRAQFDCADGRPLYAAFCATRLRLFQPGRPRLGDRLRLAGELSRIGASRLASRQSLRLGDDEIGRIELVSVFVGHDNAARNRSVVRRAPRVMAVPPAAPTTLALLARQAARIAAAPPRIEPSHHLLPCPATEFNAAGLLYFPSFAALVERADFTRGASAQRLLAERSSVYMGNVDPGETVGIGFRPALGGHLAQLAAPDGRPLALMRSRFHAV
ncbi:Pnap_2097 family protein [Frigidibacter sp. MR17.14]|uniref:Pnap_2097 family protein n=1 Tax=Frigidibacter sp. MR17.14 TaxID=3126509 RepID=UPI003013031E